MLPGRGRAGAPRPQEGGLPDRPHGERGVRQLAGRGRGTREVLQQLRGLRAERSLPALHRGARRGRRRYPGRVGRRRKSGRSGVSAKASGGDRAPMRGALRREQRTIAAMMRASTAVTITARRPGSPVPTAPSCSPTPRSACARCRYGAAEPTCAVTSIAMPGLCVPSSGGLVPMIDFVVVAQACVASLRA